MSSIQPTQGDAEWVDSPFFVSSCSSESQTHHHPNLINLPFMESFFSFLNEDEITNSTSLSGKRVSQLKTMPLPVDSNRDIPPNFPIITPREEFSNIMISALSIFTTTELRSLQFIGTKYSCKSHGRHSDRTELNGLFDCKKPYNLILGEKKLKDGTLLVGFFNSKTDSLRSGCIFYPNGDINCGEYDLKRKSLIRGIKTFACTNGNPFVTKISIGTFLPETDDLIEGNLCRRDNSGQRITYDFQNGTLIRTELEQKDLQELVATYKEDVQSDGSRSIGIFDPKTGHLLHGCILSSDGTCCFGRYHPVKKHLIEGYKRFSLKDPNTGKDRYLDQPKILIGEFDSVTGVLVSGFRVLFDNTLERGLFNPQTGALRDGKRFFFKIND